jgi:ABC-type uncharacterized transport system permease subunit
MRRIAQGNSRLNLLCYSGTWYHYTSLNYFLQSMSIDESNHQNISLELLKLGKVTTVFAAIIIPTPLIVLPPMTTEHALSPQIAFLRST